MDLAPISLCGSAMTNALAKSELVGMLGPRCFLGPLNTEGAVFSKCIKTWLIWSYVASYFICEYPEPFDCAAADQLVRMDFMSQRSFFTSFDTRELVE